MKFIRLRQNNASCLVRTISFILTGLFSVQAYSDSPTPVGRVVSVDGEALVRNLKQQRDQSQSQLVAGDNIFPHDIINTGEASRVKLLFQDRSIVDLAESTLFRVDRFQMEKSQTQSREVDLSLGYGKIRTSVTQKIGNKGKFRIRTKGAVMGVRGTELLVSAQPSRNGGPVETQVTVVRGLVDVRLDGGLQGLGQSLQLRPGQQIVTRSNLPEVSDRSSSQTQKPQRVAEAKPPEIRKLSDQELKDTVKKVRVKDHTFLSSITISKKPADNQAQPGARPPDPARNVASTGGPQDRKPPIDFGSKTLDAVGDTLPADGKNSPPPIFPGSGFGGVGPGTGTGFLPPPPPPPIAGVPVRVRVVFNQ